MIHEGNQRNMM